MRTAETFEIDKAPEYIHLVTIWACISIARLTTVMRHIRMNEVNRFSDWIDYDYV